MQVRAQLVVGEMTVGALWRALDGAIADAEACFHFLQPPAYRIDCLKRLRLCSRELQQRGVQLSLLPAGACRAPTGHHLSAE